ncbi:MAG: DUF2239 family protein [Rhodospirillaceae bacterium]|nr:DUF2239 family protein [Rhodospirillaceae bacterium]
MIAFDGAQCLARGRPADVALAVKAAVDRGVVREVLVFDATTSDPVEIDTRGSPDEVLRRLGGSLAPAARRPGRPKLGVVPREVTLLPRHWEWLGAQPGGASTTLRRLVDEARRSDGARTRRRQAQEAAYRFLSAMAGDRIGFEEAARALFAGRRDDFRAHASMWPNDIATHANALADAAFADLDPPASAA